MKKILIFLLLSFTLSYSQVIRNSTGGSGGTLDLSSIELTADTTLNFTSSNTAAEINAEIATIPKNLGAYTLTLQFADGNYSFSEKLFISGFYNGIIEVLGNASDNTNGKTKNVNIDFSHSGFGFHFFNCFALINTRYLKISFTSGQGFLVEKSYYAYIEYSYIVGDSNTGTTCIQLATSNFGRVTKCTIGLSYYGIFAVTGGMIWSFDNVDGTGADIPVYGNVAADASTLVKTGTGVTGTTANDLAASGGVIR